MNNNLEPKKWFKVIPLKPSAFTPRGVKNRIKIKHNTGFRPTIEQIIRACKENNACYALNNHVYYICEIYKSAELSLTEEQLRENEAYL